MNGKWQKRAISSTFPINLTTSATEIIFLSVLGILAVIIRAYLRIPLNLPGHHGLEVMTVLLFGRSVSKFSFASSVSSIAGALFILFPFMGFKDPFLPVIYILMGLAIDFLFHRFQSRRPTIFFMFLLGGIAYMIIPLSRLAIHFISAYPYSTFIKHGFIIPLLTHFIFGALGAVMAYGLYSSYKKTIRKN